MNLQNHERRSGPRSHHLLPVLLPASSAVVLHERLRRIEWGVLALSAPGAGLIALSSK